MQYFNSKAAKFAYHAADKDIDTNKPIIIWAHGWGHSHKNFMQLAAPFENSTNNIMIDFPGFGDSPAPPDIWGTEDYAQAIADWFIQEDMPPVIWIGHSFGCRVGVQLASAYPDRIKAMGLIAGAGLKSKKPALKKIYIYLRIKLFKILKKLIPDGQLKDKIIGAFGSTDYKNSNGTMRKIFVRVVNEDLSEQAKKIKCPVTLIYGKNDTATPPEFGKIFSGLIPDAKLFLLDGQDHNSVLENGRHQVIKILDDFIKGNK